MAKRKSVTTVRLSEIGRCIRLLHGMRHATPYNETVKRGISLSIAALGQYKKVLKEADTDTARFSNKSVQAIGETLGEPKT